MMIAESVCRTARRLRWLTLGGLGLVALGTAGAAAIQLSTGPHATRSMLEVDAAGLPPAQGAILLLAIGLLIGLALLRLARMLSRVEQGAPFAGGGDLRGFAFYLFLSVLAGILLPPLLQLAGIALSGGGTLTFSLEGGQLLMLLVTGLLFLVARLLDEAQRVADDASQIV